MNRITKPRPPEEEKYIFTEGINYFDTGKSSIWGACDTATLKLLDKTNISGKWLNLAAGDGRYNLKLLKKARFVVASDVDEGALSKLWHTTPWRYKKKLQIKAFDVTQKFPFKDSSFDGVFCTGTLHLFPEKILRKTLGEIDRVLKSHGKIIIDFATDIRRVLQNGKLYARKNAPQHTSNEVLKLLKKLFKPYNIQIQKSEVQEEEINTLNHSYKFNCQFILLVAEKK